MRRSVKAIALAVLAAMIFAFAACSKTVSPEDVTIECDWEFQSLETDGDTYDRNTWRLYNAVDPSESVPFPEFYCYDGENCTLQFNGKEHPGVMVLNDDGSYTIYNDDSLESQWGTATIEGNVLHVYLGDNVAEIEFIAVA